MLQLKGLRCPLAGRLVGAERKEAVLVGAELGQGSVQPYL